MKKFVASLIAVVLVFGAFSVNVLAYEGKTELVVASGSLGPSLDPVGTNDMPSSRHQRQIFDTLIMMRYIDGQIVLEPGLAVSWEFLDPSTLKLQLREGVLFHNGELFTANDVKFSLERAIESSFSRPIVEMIDEIIVDGDYEVTIKTLFPFAPLLNHLTHTSTSIVSAAAVEEFGDSFGENPVGTGPFKYVSRVVQSELVFERFDDYWGELPVLEKLRILEIPIQATRLILVETGGADIAVDIAPADVRRAEANPNLTLERGFTFSLSPYIGFNTLKEPFDNHLVRQAINYATDTQALVDVVFRGVGAPAHGPLSEMVWGFAELEAFDYDVAKAKELMIEAGYPDGFETTIWWNSNNPQRGQVAEMLQFMLADIGITMEVIGVEWGQYLLDTADGLHDMFLLGWVTATGDPDYGLFNVFHSNNHGTPGNRTFYTNARVDELLEAGRVETDPDARLVIYAELQQILRDDAPWIPVLQGEELVVLSNSVRGFELTPTTNYWFWLVHFE
ncbi:MAG: ABC transporter substrate-binding protein [Defluviitaleaceae bacterium]|nr:ABC transporter substrate-binding protein [Defluviitaleaceae bacterium]MCL2835952.1 ABC transporter substrate-binding protein [Defluviitaleaceae bacterium]